MGIDPSATSFQIFGSVLIGLLICTEAFLIWPAVLAGIYSLATKASFTQVYTPRFLGLYFVISWFLFLSSEIFMNIVRYLLRYPWCEYVIPCFGNVLMYGDFEDDDILLFNDLNAYKDITNLTEFYQVVLEEIKRAKAANPKGKKECDRYKNFRHFRKSALTRIPKQTKRLFDEDNLEIRTHEMEWLTREHVRMVYNHKAVVAREHGYSFFLRMCEHFIDIWGLLLDFATMDEFWLNGEMVAWQITSIIGHSQMDCYYCCKSEARKLNIYFIGSRLSLKRALADPDVMYYNMMTTAPACSEAKRVVCFQEMLGANADWEVVAEVYGLPGDEIDMKNLSGWWKCLFGGRRRIRKELWSVSDVSDLVNGT